jgi:hypothetical protein
MIVASAVLALAVWPVPGQEAAQQKAVVLTGATVIDGTGGAPLRNATVVIANGTFTAVGGATLRHPPDATVVDLSGRYVIPGLVESHVHYEEWMGEILLNHGVTSAFALAVGGRFPPGLIDKKAASQRPDVRMPRLYTIGEGGVRLSASMSEEEVRQAVRRYLEQKPDFAGIGTFTGRNKQAFQWAADEAHRAGLLIFGHTEDAVESVRAGHDIVEHVWGYALAAMSAQEREDFQQGKYLHWGTFFSDTARIDQVVKEAVDRGAYINPTLFFEFGSPPRLAETHESETGALYGDRRLMAYYPRNIADSLVHQVAAFRNFSARYPDLVSSRQVKAEDGKEFERAFRLTGEFLKRFVAAGGKIQAGTDAPSGGTPGLSLHHEMELLVEAGLSPMQALQSATLWSAETLSGRGGIRGRPPVGVIAEGAPADLVVLAANPLENIANTRKIQRVIKGGAFIELGYDPAYFTFTAAPRRVAMATPAPAVSAITPHTVIEGGAGFELVVEGAGFMIESLVQVDGVSLPTTVVSPRTLKAVVPAHVIQRAEPPYVTADGPPQKPGVIADRIVPVTVYTPAPEGGVSNKVFLRVRAQWLAGKPPMTQ